MTPGAIAALAWDKQGGLLPAVVQHAQDARVLMLGYMDRAALQATLDTGLVTFFSRSRQRAWTKGETSGNMLACVSIAADCDGDALLVRAQPRGPTCHRGTASCFDAVDTPYAQPATTVDGAIRGSHVRAGLGDAALPAAGPRRPEVSAPGSVTRTGTHSIPGLRQSHPTAAAPPTDAAPGETPAPGGGAMLAALDALLARRAVEMPEGSYSTRLFAAGVHRIAQKVGEEGVETALAAVAQDDAALLGEAADLVYHLLALLRARGLSLADVEAVLASRAPSSPREVAPQ